MRIIAVFLAFQILIIFGCSSTNNSPLTLGNNGDSLESKPVIGLSDSGDSVSAIGVLGAYELIINPDTLDISLVSKRLSSLGESYIVSGTPFFTLVPCSDCLSIKTYTFGPQGELVITFSVDHPFRQGDIGAPPSSMNRLDLDVFDVAAVFVPRPGEADSSLFTRIGVSVYSDVCLGQDGFTTELSGVLNDTTACPYFLVIDESSEPAPTNNRLAMGSVDSEFDVAININPLIPRFDVYLTMGYGASAKKPTRLNPTYFIPEFNRKAAWKVNVIPPPPGDTWMNNDSFTTKNVVVEVYDWQAGAIVSEADPYSSETDTTKVNTASEVASVSVEIPGMNSTPPSVGVATSGTGAPNNPLIFEVPVANQNQILPGEYISLVKVLDNRAPGMVSVGGENNTLVDTPDGLELNWYSMSEFATYQIFTAIVEQACGPVIGQIDDPNHGKLYYNHRTCRQNDTRYYCFSGKPGRRTRSGLYGGFRLRWC